MLSTGGSIANLTKDWAQKSKFVQNLTLMGLAVAAKTGLLGALGKWLIAAVLICKKFIIVIVVGLFAGVKAFFGGKKKSDEGEI